MKITTLNIRKALADMSDEVSAFFDQHHGDVGLVVTLESSRPDSIFYDAWRGAKGLYSGNGHACPACLERIAEVYCALPDYTTYHAEKDVYLTPESVARVSAWLREGEAS